MADQPAQTATSPTPVLAVPVEVRAVALGERLDTRLLESNGILGRAPLVVRMADHGLAVAFRYGVIVLVNVPPADEDALRQRLADAVSSPYQPVEEEELRIVVRADGDEQMEVSGTVCIKELSVERVQVIAEVLARSVVMGYYESRIAATFDMIERLAEPLRLRARASSEERALLRQIGNILHVQYRTVGRVGTGEKPDVLWDHPELERLHSRLVEEYDLRERARALDRKFEVISRSVETLLTLAQQRSTMRVEWYVVILILIEIVISIYELVRG
jgi:uncharacterized Rmd1/YagE family protein